MAIDRQEALPEVQPGPRRRVWCRGFHRPLSDAVSRLRGYGEECDPDQRTTTPAHDVDQDPIPGL